MLYMQSTNGNDGTMQLTVTFDIDTDPNIDQVNVQNRIAQAQPNLPTEVTQYGLTMRKSTGLPMMVVSLFSPENSYDALFLANYANINLDRRAVSRPGRRRSAHLRRGRLRDAHLGQAGPPRHARPDRARPRRARFSSRARSIRRARSARGPDRPGRR